MEWKSGVWRSGLRKVKWSRESSRECRVGIRVEENKGQSINRWWARDKRGETAVESGI